MGTLAVMAFGVLCAAPITVLYISYVKLKYDMGRLDGFRDCARITQETLKSPEMLELLMKKIEEGRPRSMKDLAIDQMNQDNHNSPGN